jgi:hypothetical protein
MDSGELGKGKRKISMVNVAAGLGVKNELIRAQMIFQESEFE